MYSWTGSSLRTEVETPSFSQSTECRWLAAAPCTVTLPLLAQLYYLHLFACWNCCISGGNSYILSISRRCVCVCLCVLSCLCSWKLVSASTRMTRISFPSAQVDLSSNSHSRKPQESQVRNFNLYFGFCFELGFLMPHQLPDWPLTWP